MPRERLDGVAPRNMLKLEPDPNSRRYAGEWREAGNRPQLFNFGAPQGILL